MAKKLAPQIYANHREECYCGYRFSGVKVDLASCGYQPKHDVRRATRLEWEHVVPAEVFGQSFREWRKGHPSCVDSKGRPVKGRNCPKKVSIAFRHMEGDLHNLEPAIGEINGLRSSYSMAMIEGDAREFGACDVEIADRKIEPRSAIRGDIARIYLYIVATSFFPIAQGPCEVERLVVCCGSRSPLIRRAHHAPGSLSSTLVERYWNTPARHRFCA